MFTVESAEEKTGEILRRKAVSDGVMRIGAEQQATTAPLRKKVTCSERMAASRSTPVSSEKNRGYERDSVGSNGRGSRENICNERERRCSRKE